MMVVWIFNNRIKFQQKKINLLLKKVDRNLQKIQFQLQE
jgi:hypothetical protein